MSKIRYFEEVSKEFIKHPNVKTEKPTRSDLGVAGYDIQSKESATIRPGETHAFWTDIKAIMLPDEVLFIHVRSSIGIKNKLVLANTTGVVDHSHANNPKNDGNIGVFITNKGDQDVHIEIGDRIAQGVFSKYLLVDGDEASEGARLGAGIGSTGK